MGNNKIIWIMVIIGLVMIATSGEKKEVELCSSPLDCHEYPCWFCLKDGKSGACAHSSLEEQNFENIGYECASVNQDIIDQQRDDTVTTTEDECDHVGQLSCESSNTIQECLRTSDGSLLWLLGDCPPGQTCSQGVCVGTSSDALVLRPSATEYKGDILIGESKSISVAFYAYEALNDAVLEAQLMSVAEPKKAATIIDVNRCDILAGVDEDPLFRNEQVDFSRGQEKVVTFVFTPPHAGWFDIHVDALSDCRGDVDLVPNTLVGSFFVQPDERTTRDGIIPSDENGIDGVTDGKDGDGVAGVVDACNNECLAFVQTCEESSGECKISGIIIMVLLVVGLMIVLKFALGGKK